MTWVRDGSRPGSLAESPSSFRPVLCYVVLFVKWTCLIASAVRAVGRAGRGVRCRRGQSGVWVPQGREWRHLRMAALRIFFPPASSIERSATSSLLNRYECMRRLGVGVLLCCGLLSSTAYAHNKSSLGCVRRGERVVGRLSAGAVVRRTQRVPGQPRYEDASETHWWACLPGGRRRYLGRTTARPEADGEGGETYNGFNLAGRFLAFRWQYSSTYGPERERILEVDLRTGRRSVLWAVIGEPASIPHVLTFPEVQAPVGPPLLAVDAQGVGAWMIREGGTRMVLVHDRLGTHVAASYPTVEAETEPTFMDLVISKGQVSWSHNGTTVTAVA